MIVREMTDRVLGGAAAAISAVAGVARHFAWYVSHQLGGDAREGDERRGEGR